MREREEVTPRGNTALEAAQGRMDGFFGQLQYKCHIKEVASVGNWPEISPQLNSRVALKDLRACPWKMAQALLPKAPPAPLHRHSFGWGACVATVLELEAF